MKSRTHIQDTAELWRLTMEHSPIGMALVSVAGDILAVNSALCDMLGHEPEALTGMTVRDITHPDDIETDRRLSRDAMDGTIDTFRIAKRYLRGDGSVMTGELTAAMVCDDRGEPIHFVSQIVDVSERRAFEARLESAEAAVDSGQRLADALLESVSVGLLLVDADGTYSAYNRRQQELLDIAFPDGHLGVAGQTGFVYDEDQAQTLTFEQFPCARATAGEEFDDQRIWIGEEPASRRALSVSARTVHDRSGVLTGAVLAYNDVTELVRAIQVRDDFLASVSHELRTPLTAALAYLELLDGNEDLGDAARAHVDAVHRNALRLSHLVADLLFTATATSGVPVVDPARVDLALVVDQAAESARLDADGAEVSLEVDRPGTLVAVADGIRMRQVVDNLIANAITFTPTGGRVRVALAGSDDQVELVVADSGEGIEESDLDDIFTSFTRGQNARRRLSPGTGLGLAIVRTIVEAHGGQVSVQSTPGVGTTVRVVVPR